MYHIIIIIMFPFQCMTEYTEECSTEYETVYETNCEASLREEGSQLKIYVL